jgi:hypothetical protein
MARPSYQPTDQDTRTVQTMAACGFPHAEICTILDIDEKTLRKHFRDTLDKAMIQADAKVSQTMFQMATSGEHPGMTAFWMKVRRRWKEPANDHRFVDESGKDRPFLLSDADRLIAEADAEINSGE